MKVPIPEKRYPHYHIESPGILQQIDIIQFPLHNGYGCLLLIIDINNRMCDGRPLPIKIGSGATSQMLITACDNIYNIELFENPSYIDNYRIDDGGNPIPWLQVPNILQGDDQFSAKEFGGVAMIWGLKLR